MTRDSVSFSSSRLTATLVLVGLVLCSAASAPGDRPTASSRDATLIVVNAKVTTLDESRPAATALAVRDGLFVAVGGNADVMPLRGENTQIIDADGRRVIPGLDDSHLHAVRAGRFYNLELRWDGVNSLARALEMVKQQAARTPPGQWVRVVGGWSPFQFKERRMPTIADLNAAAPETPVFVMFLYSQGLLNQRGVEALGLTPESTPPEGGRYEFLDGGAILHADPNPAILYLTVARLPDLALEDQINSTRHFFRELNRYGITSVTDPGGGGQEYPIDYEATRVIAGESALPVRISSYLFAQKRGSEILEYRRHTSRERFHLNLAAARLNGYMIRGAGENLVWSAGDFENFLAPRPELDSQMESELAAVVRLLASHQWPIRIHATYDESITRILDVFEPVFAETGYTARWCIDHVETISARNIERIKSMGGGIAIQNRMAFAGEHFAARYGREAASNAPPLRELLEVGIPLGAGTDGTRVSSYNPWIALQWLVSGRTLGGMPLAREDNQLTRTEALELYTIGSAWFSGEEHTKGRIAIGQFADFAILSDDFFTVAEHNICRIESVLTVTGGDVVYAGEPYLPCAPEQLPPVSPDWSPVRFFEPMRQSVTPVEPQ